MQALQDAVIDYLANNGYAAVFVLMVLESACIPIPSEVTMLVGGALADPSFVSSIGADNQLNVLMVGLVGAVANLVGSWIAWGVGWRGGRPLVERYGRYIFLNHEHLEKTDEWFEKHGDASVFFSRLLPVLRTFISLPAGIARMPFWRFTIYTFLGCLPWTIALAYVGAGLGSQWHKVDHYMKPVSYGLAAVCAVVAVWWLLRQRKKAKASADA